MGREKYVGRVGALAVALGIGSAVAVLPGQAWAEPDSSSTAGASASSAAESDGGKDSDATSTTRSGSGSDTESDTDGAIDRDSDDEASAELDSDDDAAEPDATDTADLDDAKLTEEKSDSRPSDGGVDEDADHDDAAQARTPDRESGPQRESESVVATTPPTTPNDEAADPDAVAQEPAVTETTTPAVEEPTDATDPAGTAEVEPRATTLATVVKALFAPKAAASPSSTPGSPAAAPLLWTLATFARRQLDEQAAVTSQTSAEIPGDATQSPIIGTDGTAYQVSTDSSNRVSRVTILDSSGQVVTTSDDLRGNAAHAVARPDGTLIVLTTSYFGTTVSAVDADGEVRRVASLIGQPERNVTVGSDGALYVRTAVPKLFSPVGETVGFRTYRISPANVTRSYSFDTDVTVAPDGTAYLVSSRYGFSNLRVIRSDGWTRTTPLPFGADPSAPILGQDANAYVTAGITPFGVAQTRLYTATSTSTTVRTISGLPGDALAGADGVYLATFIGSDDGATGTTYISRATATTLDTSELIDGRIAGLQVSRDGTVYAPIDDPAPTGTSVAVVDPDGTVRIVTLPGALVVRQRTIRNGGLQSAEDAGYVNYTAEGREFVAVLNPDGTVSRTIELPDGASGGSVFFSPDGAAYELLEYRDAQGEVVSRQILALATTTYTANVPGGRFNYVGDDVVFGPDGIGYLLTGSETGLPGNPLDLDVLGFDATGATVSRASGLTSPETTYENNPAREVLAFGRDGTAYVTLYNSYDDPGVYAVTASGAQKVVDLDYVQYDQAYPATFGLDGTGYVTTGPLFSADPDSTSTVTTFVPLTTL